MSTKATDIVVKNAANVDVTFVSEAPAAGYGSIAHWSVKNGPNRSVYPRFTTSVSQSTSNTAQGKFKLTMPAYYADVTTGLPVITSKALVTTSLAVPEDFPASQIDDLVAYHTNLLRSNLIQATMKALTPNT